MKWEKNEQFTARIDGYTSEGAGVCHMEGRAVFVPGALMGELWEIRIVKVSRSAIWGRGENLLEASESRCVPDCPAFPKCGGCALRHMDYREELELKLLRVNDGFHRIGGLDFTIDTILAADSLGANRNKVIWNVGTGTDGQPIAGFYRARSHDIIPSDHCPAVPELTVHIKDTVLSWMKTNSIPVYNEVKKTDGVRHIFIRISHLSGKAVVTLTVSRTPSAAKLNALIGELRNNHPEMSGFVLNLNRSRGNTVLDGDFQTLWGTPDLQEGLCGLKFQLSPRSFFQVNPPQAEKLYNTALDYAALSPDTLALDLYCGTGTIGLCMAARGARVIGAEVVEPAVINARKNAVDNGLSEQCEFICADAGEASELLRNRGTRPEVIVVDPPRKGLSEEVIRAAVGMAPDRIVYVSCDPGTLARDLALFSDAGYTAKHGTCVDMFPRTAHVETVVLMSPALADITE